MIEAKAIRSTQSAPDPSDPLGLKRPPAAEMALLPGLVGGLIGLALYLRSFLWAPAEAAIPTDEPMGSAGGDDQASTPQQTAKVQSQRQSNDDERGPVGREQAVEETMSVRLPQVFGPFESGIFALAPTTPGFQGPRIPANAPLPPFNGRQESAMADGAAPPASVTAPDIAPWFPADGIVVPVVPIVDGEEADPPPGEEDPVRPTPPSERNRAPRNSGPVYVGEVGSGGTLAIMLAHLVSNSTDPDGDALQIDMGTATHGIIEDRGEGWRFLSDTEHLGEVRIAYEVKDGEFAVEQTAILRVIENRFDGTERADLIVGTLGRDVINAQPGDDNIAGLGGRDVIHGDAGNDNIAGGHGNDTLFGGTGDDLVAGGEGDDWISGGEGNDTLYGEEGADVIYGDAGHDSLDGGEGSDLLFGGDGDDQLDGSAGNDILSGNAGNDHLDGGEGSDILSGGAHADSVQGGEGDDMVLADDDAAPDYFDGGEGQDRLDYSAATDSVAFDLIAGTAEGESVGTDTFVAFEHIVGGAESDSFRASAGSATLTGNGGSDLFAFVQGDAVEPTLSIYRITDFGMSNVISISSMTSTTHMRKSQKTVEDRIEDFFEDFSDGIGADEPKLRFSHDWTHEYRQTLIEVDFDRDDAVDLMIMLDGEHMLVLDQT